MQQEFQWPAVQAFVHLTQANMQLFASTCGQKRTGSDHKNSVSPLAVSAQLMQGLSSNYTTYLKELNGSALSLFAGGRGMVDYFAKH